LCMAVKPGTNYDIFDTDASARFNVSYARFYTLKLLNKNCFE